MSKVFESAVRKLDNLLLNRAPWERLDHTQDRGSAHLNIEWVEYEDPGTEQYVRVEHGIGEDNVVIGARIAYMTFRRLHVNTTARMIIVRDITSTRTVHLADLQDNRWFGGIAIQTQPLTDPSLIQHILALVVDAAHTARSG
jgi:hypothetical protein